MRPSRLEGALAAGLRAVDRPWPLSLILGLASFLVAVVLQPPFFVVVLALSLPFFAWVVNARWKEAAAWTILTVPFQYYFNVGGLALTITELYMFLFGGAFFLSRVVPQRAFAFPALLLLPLLYSLTPFLPLALGKAAVAKEGIRLFAAVFFCPRPPRSASIGRNPAAFSPAW